MKWTIENYNAFLREARSEVRGLSQAGARELYREVRDWKAGPAYGADVPRYIEAIEAGGHEAADSVLVPLMGPNVVGKRGQTYPPDFGLGADAELELTASVSSGGAGQRALHLKIRIITNEPMTVGEAEKLLRATMRTGFVPNEIDLAWVNWRRPSTAGTTRGRTRKTEKGRYLDDEALDALRSFYGAIHHDDTRTRVEVIDEG